MPNPGCLGWFPLRHARVFRAGEPPGPDEELRVEVPAASLTPRVLRAVDVATQLGLVGWVRNADDERAVELVAEGDPTALDAFLPRLESGPSGARVDSVEADRGPATGGLTRFEIRR